MPTSAAGSKQAAQAERRDHTIAPTCTPVQRGFTLIELMVVVALIAVATAGAALSLRDSASTALERDAQRLAALLESARAQARASDARVVWQVQEGSFVWQGLPRAAAAHTWLSPDTRSRNTDPVVLGPEPLIAPQRIELYSATQPGQRLWVVSDGLRPFGVERTAGGPP